MRIINICDSDWANFSFENCQAMRAVGLDAHSFKLIPHHFGYEKESTVVDKITLQWEIRDADIIQIMHSNIWMLNLCKKFRNKKLYVYHTGTTYRENSERINAAFNPFVIRAFTDQTEFIGTGMKGEYYFTSPVDIDRFSFSEWQSDKVTFAHYPSSTSIKGSEIINRTLRRLSAELELDYKYNSTAVKHSEQIKRMGECDVYIELFSPYLNGKKYGCFGVTALEAAALGKVVVTNHTTAHVYNQFYKVNTPFVCPKDEAELYLCLKRICELSKNNLEIKKLETRFWMEQNHSYRATGILIKKLLNL